MTTHRALGPRSAHFAPAFCYNDPSIAGVGDKFFRRRPITPSHGVLPN